MLKPSHAFFALLHKELRKWRDAIACGKSSSGGRLPLLLEANTNQYTTKQNERSRMLCALNKYVQCKAMTAREEHPMLLANHSCR